MALINNGVSASEISLAAIIINKHRRENGVISVWHQRNGQQSMKA
jgi:hypothetical protein